MTKIRLFGESGKMGKAIKEILPHFPKLTLSSAGNEDAFIDFTHPTALQQNLEIALKANKPIVIGTTGLSQADFQALENAAHQIPVLYAANMSIGIATLNHLVRQATLLLGAEFDIEIAEAHHRNKVDAPSGTAIALGKTVADARENSTLNLQGHQGKRAPLDIGFSVTRGGGVIGDHAVSFISDEECITLSHRALTRALFARGALRATQWLIKQKPGYYSLEDTLKNP